ncbi:hypothetical protein FB451DRAFT_1168915 [Mycena latifolia]|nr:hypothetical protein FB451DRAFT_1168915 [Mycena latifolia]
MSQPAKLDPTSPEIPGHDNIIAAANELASDSLLCTQAPLNAPNRETVRVTDRCFLALLASRLLSIPRMSHRLVLSNAAAPHWTPCGQMDLSTHLREHSLAPGGGYAELRSLIEHLAQALVDLTRPPWDIALIHRPGRGSVLFSRTHHVIADGRGLTAILAACTDEPRCTLLPPAHPRRSPRRPVAAAWLQRLLVLAELKHVARSLGGGTLNDVVLAAVAGALRTYMLAHGDDPGRQRIHCKVPVDVRSDGERPDGAVTLGNHLGDLNVPLPVDVGTAVGRFARMHLAGGIPVVDVRYHPWALANIGVGFVVYSYHDRVNIAVCTDRKLIAEPDVVCGYLEDEIRLLAGAAESSSTFHEPHDASEI